MRRILEFVGAGALISLFWITWSAVYGSERLPARIPIHFDLSGQPNGWGSPSALLVLPVVAMLLYLGMTLVAQFPQAFNYPVRVTAQNRPRLQALSLRMIAWIKVEMVCLFAGIQWSIVQGVRQGSFRLSPALVPVSIAVIFGTIIAHIAAMFRAARPSSS
jgi:uncharacterized membrane protein